MSALFGRFSRFANTGQWIYLAGIVLAIVLIIPAAWFPLQVGKIAAFSTLLAVAVIAFVAAGSMRGLLYKGGLKIASLVLLLPIVYALSYWFSTDRTVGIYGTGLEVDTLFFVILGAVAFVMAFGYFRSARSMRTLISVVFISFIAAAVFQTIAVVFGQTALPWAPFADRTVNLVGKWNDLGLILGIVTLWSLMRLEWSPMSRAMRIALYVALALALVLLGIIHFTVVWLLVGAFSLVIAVVAYLVRRPSDSTGFNIRQVPFIPLGVAAVCIVFLIFGTMLNTSLLKVFPVTSVEVRPSYDTTMEIVRATHTSPSRALLGTGPDTFGQMWITNKPAGVNQSDFWNLDFNVAYSTIMTAFAGVGILGALAWFIPLILVLFAWVRVLRSNAREHNEKFLASLLAFAAIYLWLGAVFYVMSQNLILLAFVISGALIGFAYSFADEHPVHRSRLSMIWVIAASLVLVGAVGWNAVQADRIFFSSVYTNKALIALNSGDMQQASAYITKSQSAFYTGDNLRAAASISLTRMQALAQSTSTDQTALQTEFTAETQKAIASSQAAINLHPLDYRGYISLAQVYHLLSSVKVTGAYQLAEQTYIAAANVNPTNPIIPLTVARLESENNNTANTQAAITRALTLKSNYTDAILFVVQLNVTNKDIPGAIKAAQAAVQSAPGVASIWFELGLLYYTNNEPANAIEPLEQAIKLQSDYANAQYFLGLAYYDQKRAPEAIALFQNLQTTNPDNAEVKLILSNMQTGKPALTGVQTAAPEDRQTAPISQ
ncbi:MAG: hypothetical protein JWO43_658 [Candidatus Adlerbacteria bacterium]|nr:hypothetical protein [Candidatus Adlerbacteria bacterium]